jgi:hypothetical protein
MRCGFFHNLAVAVMLQLGTSRAPVKVGIGGGCGKEKFRPGSLPSERVPQNKLQKNKKTFGIFLVMDDIRSSKAEKS